MLCRSGKPLPKHLELVQNSQALSRTQAEKLLDRLKSSDDPLFEHVASSLAAGREPVSTEPAPGTLHAAPASAMPPPPPKFSTFSAFKKKLMPKFGKPKKTDDSFPAVPPPTTQLPPGALGHGYSPGSYDHFAAEAGGIHRIRRHPNQCRCRQLCDQATVILCVTGLIVAGHLASQPNFPLNSLSSFRRCSWAWNGVLQRLHLSKGLHSGR